MDGSSPGHLRVWEAWNLTETSDWHVPSANPLGSAPSRHADLAARLYVRETLRSTAKPGKTEEPTQPYTLQWFLQIENQRHQRYAKWLPRLLEFTKHAGETLLGLGSGLGTDWVQYARHGAAVVICSSATQELALARRNFELRGLPARFLHARPSAVPLESATIDVACVSALLEAETDPVALVEEVHRVLKPGGKVLVLAPARYDLEHWLRLLLPWDRFLHRPQTPPEARVQRFTARQLRQLFGRFTEHRIHKRHLRRAEMPHLWRWLPLPMLERWFGHFLILKAFKPLSSAIPVPVAA